jgi:coatomer subunit beta'
MQLQLHGGQWLTAAGHVHIWSYISQSIVKTFELTDVPVRAGRFVARKNWIVAGANPTAYIHIRIHMNTVDAAGR